MSSSKQPDLPVDPEAIAVAAGLSVERRRALRKRARRRVRQGRSPSEPEAYLDLLVGTLPRDRLDAAAIEVIEASVAA